jgi:pimeloyl-ACP methyl ester carboxylesterase
MRGRLSPLSFRGATQSRARNPYAAAMVMDSGLADLQPAPRNDCGERKAAQHLTAGRRQSIAVRMKSFSNNGVEIAYLDEGEGEPIVLVHGFASTKDVNWVNPGWVSTLTRAGRRVIALDNRGHGASAKLYEPAAYHSAVMADDVRALLDHLDIERADVMGYSMGARISAFLALAHPGRVRSVILGGLGSRLVDGVGLPESIAEALEAPSLADVHDVQGRTFRAFADQTKSDRRALAACIRGSRQTVSREDCTKLAMPVLVAVGTKDDVAGSAQELAALLPDGRALDIPGRDHMLAVGDRVYKQGVLDFLAQKPA